MKINVTDEIQCFIIEKYEQEVEKDGIVRCYQVKCTHMNDLDCDVCNVFNGGDCNINYDLVKV